ncbi:MAG: hypothetical protein HDS09_07665 [Bacteroides sp.]|nr:hypothetical protein [Bacteroides sp.]
MARPIKDTPILRGKDAERFVERMLRTDERKENTEKREKRLAAYETIRRMMID